MRQHRAVSSTPLGLVQGSIGRTQQIRPAGMLAGEDSDAKTDSEAKWARLGREVGEAAFWRGLASYTRKHAGKLVDSRDFQRAMESAAGRSLTALFEEGVYR